MKILIIILLMCSACYAETIDHKNLSYKNEDWKGVVFKNCNLTQESPNTIMKAKDCEFISCNLKNCSLDASNKITDCNTIQQTIVKDDIKKETIYTQYNKQGQVMFTTKEPYAVSIDSN